MPFPKINWASFQGRQKNGDHFGVNLGIISGLGIISESKRKYHTEAKKEGMVEQKHVLEESGTVYV